MLVCCFISNKMHDKFSHWINSYENIFHIILFFWLWAQALLLVDKENELRVSELVWVYLYVYEYMYMGWFNFSKYGKKKSTAESLTFFPTTRHELCGSRVNQRSGLYCIKKAWAFTPPWDQYLRTLTWNGRHGSSVAEFPGPHWLSGWGSHPVRSPLQTAHSLKQVKNYILEKPCQHTINIQ